MNLIFFFGAMDHHMIPVVGAAGMILFVCFLFMAIWASRYRKVGPDEVLVISGRRVVVRDADGKTHVCGFRFVKGGGTFVFPVVEQASVLSLKPVSLELAMPRVATRGGGSARLGVRAQVRIRLDDLSIARAAESLLGKEPQEVKDIAGQLLESALRDTLGARSAEEVLRNERGLSVQLQEAARPGLAELGLELLSFTVRDLEILAKGTGV